MPKIIRCQVQAFAGAQGQSDDMTYGALRYFGRQRRRVREAACHLYADPCCLISGRDYYYRYQLFITPPIPRPRDGWDALESGRSDAWRG